MIERIIRSSANKPFLAFVLILTLSALGVLALRDLRRDVFPDLSAPLFNVIVQNPAMGAEELEANIAIPLETALAGLPGTKRIRSVNQLGVSQVTIEFEPNADYARSRQLVARFKSRAMATYSCVATNRMSSDSIFVVSPYTTGSSSRSGLKVPNSLSQMISTPP